MSRGTGRRPRRKSGGKTYLKRRLVVRQCKGRKGSADENEKKSKKPTSPKGSEKSQIVKKRKVTARKEA